MNYLDIIKRGLKDFTCTGVLYNSKGEVVNEIFDEGKSLKELASEKFTIIIDEKAANAKGIIQDKIAGFVQDAGAVFILSDKACKFFKDSGVTNFEYFDLTIKGKKTEIKTHKLVNVVGEKIDCINFEKSKIKLWKENLDVVEYLELDETKIPENLSVFLLGRCPTATIFIKPQLTEKIKKELTGFVFKDVDQFTINA